MVVVVVVVSCWDGEALWGWLCDAKKSWWVEFMNFLSCGGAVLNQLFFCGRVEIWLFIWLSIDWLVAGRVIDVRLCGLL